jgi:hypothetical protein
MLEKQTFEKLHYLSLTHCQHVAGVAAAERKST